MSHGDAKDEAYVQAMTGADEKPSWEWRQEVEALTLHLRANDDALGLTGAESRPQVMYIMDLKQQLATVTQERDEVLRMVNVQIDATIEGTRFIQKLQQQLATARRETMLESLGEIRTAVSEGKFIPLDKSFTTSEMFQTIHWLEAYLDERAQAAKEEA
jgi:CHAT domain-containing protein